MSSEFPIEKTESSEVGFFDSLRVELRGSGVGVTVIAPGFVETEIQKRALDRKGKSLGESPVVDRSMFLSAEKAADIIVSGMEKRKRLVVTNRKIHFARWIYPLFPKVVECLTQKAFHDACGEKTF
jgi:short-subunit dehydrogenase